MGYDVRRLGRFPSVVRWQLCRGISGNFRVEWLAILLWNQWQLLRGMAGNFAVEWLATFAWNTHLLEAMEAETQGPLTPCRAVRHPGDEASAHQKHGAEHCARGAERAGTAKYQMKREITEKKRVLSMVEGAGARVRALCS